MPVFDRLQRPDPGVELRLPAVPPRVERDSGAITNPARFRPLSIEPSQRICSARATRKEGESIPMDRGLSTASASDFSDRHRRQARFALDTAGGAAYPCRPSFRPPCACFSATFASCISADESPHEAYLPTEQSASSAHSRLSRPHGHPSGSSGPRPAPREGSQASHCLSGCARFAPAAHALLSSTCLSPARPFKPAQRLRQKSEFDRVYRDARRSADASLRDICAQHRRGRSRALDWRSPPASSGMRSAAIASSVSFANRFASISMNCPQSISSSTRAPARATRTTQRSRAASNGIGER